jgi:hypothetical protein
MALHSQHPDWAYDGPPKGFNADGKRIMDSEPAEEQKAAPMADERETAQWYMAQGIGATEARELFKQWIVPELFPYCFQFGSLKAWQPLPEPAKHVLRIELARVRAIGEAHELAAGRDPKTGDDLEVAACTEFCPEHGEVVPIDEEGIARCPTCDRATSTTPEEARRFETQA